MALISKHKVLIKINDRMHWFDQASLFESAWKAIPSKLSYIAQEIYIEESDGFFECYKNTTNPHYVGTVLTPDDVVLWLLGSTQLNSSMYRGGGTSSSGPK